MLTVHILLLHLGFWYVTCVDSNAYCRVFGVYIVRNTKQIQ